MIRSQRQVKQGEFWVARNDLARAQASRFYEKLQETLETLGFAAKVCIHPRQLAVVHDVFTPTDDELVWARRVVDAAGAAKGRGAIAVDGQMVDAPVVARARRLLASTT